MRVVALPGLLLASACNLVFGVDPAGGGRGADTGAADAPVAGTKAWRHVVAGVNHTCGIDDDDALWCWGENIAGQLGDGGANHRNRANQVEPGTRWKQVSLGQFHTCGIQANDSLWCWGSDSSGQLGLSGSATQLLPVAISADDGMRVTWKAVAAGSFYTLAIATDGTLWSWGADSFGQLGTGLTAPSGVALVQEEPTQVAGTSYETVDAAPLHACATTTAGALWCWGLGTSGQLARPSNTSSNVPVPAAAALGRTWAEVGVGDAHTCGRTMDDELWCWGFDEFGQVGQGQGLGTRPPARLLQGAGSLAVGARHTCALDAGGLLRCWGHSGQGRLGLDADAPVLTPAEVATDRRWSAASAGTTHTCALDAVDGTLWCTGNNGAGQLGVGVGGPAPDPVALGRTAAQVATGEGHGCLIDLAGAVSCWGASEFGQLGDGTIQPRAAPTSIVGTTTATSIALGRDSSCLIDASATHPLWCWGEGTSGQLGQGTLASASVPRMIASASPGWSVVDTGRHTCGLESNQLSCWGRHDEGQLGNATPTSTPRIVATMIGDVATGTNHTCAAGTNSLITCWGGNGSRQLGIGGTGGPTPVTVTTAAAPLLGVQVFAGDEYSCALDGADLAWCWGRNSRGQLGRAASTSELPGLVDSTRSWAHLALGREHTCGVELGTGALFCWGGNQYGQLGLGPGMATQVPTPTQVGSATWKRVAAGEYFTCGIQTDDSVWCWGRGEQGQLGDGQAWRLGFVPVPDPAPR